MYLHTAPAHADISCHQHVQGYADLYTWTALTPLLDTFPRGNLCHHFKALNFVKWVWVVYLERPSPPTPTPHNSMYT